MGRLEELMQEHCCETIKHKTLGEMCEIKTGGCLTKKDTVENGKYPIISGGVAPLGFCNLYNRNENTVTISRAGTAGYVDFIVNKFWLNDKCFSIIPFDGNILMSKFLYYALKNQEKHIMGLKSDGSVPTINTQKVAAIQIPVPPLPVQEEIVRILDTFTELKAELDAELDARRKQYEHYRNTLLSSWDCEIPMKNIQSLIDASSIQVLTPSFKIKRNDYCASGLVPIISQETEYISGYCDKRDDRITKRNYVCFGDHSEHIKFIDFEFVQGADGLKIMHTDESCLSSKYLYHALSNFYTRHNNYERHFKYLADTIIPVPPLDIQHRLVNVLDNFDAICSDLSIGLPAEISARTLQYNHYRDLLFAYAAGGLNLSRAEQSRAEQS